MLVNADFFFFYLNTTVLNSIYDLLVLRIAFSRYEVPYSEHCSFTELRAFVKFISPENIIPSVNNDGVESANAMVSLLMS